MERIGQVEIKCQSERTDLTPSQIVRLDTGHVLGEMLTDEKVSEKNSLKKRGKMAWKRIFKKMSSNSQS